MRKDLLRRMLALSAAMILSLSACVPKEGPSSVQAEGDALTWSTWNGYDGFLDLAARTYPDIQLEYSAYAGANRTGYSWAQMRGDDIPDIFITSQMLDEDLARERLVDLSSYDLINHFSTSILDQVAIDGGVYLLPVSNAMYGIYYNKTLMEEHGWELPANFAELEALCAEIREAGLIPGIVGTSLTGNCFSAVFNLAKTSWLTTPEGVNWERDFLSGDATAAGVWEGTMDYVQEYIDIGMFTPDPEDRDNASLILDYLGGRKAVFCFVLMAVNITELPETGDELGLMPFISRDGDKNVYIYSPPSYIGISERLLQPGNEARLEKALRLLSLLFSPEGQETFLTQKAPCVLSVLDSEPVPETSMIYDAQRALWDGRAFPLTYVHWENVLADMGQAFKDWLRGTGDMDGPKCITRMDELQSNYLNTQEKVYFCQSTADFTLEETARLVGMALGSAADAGAALVPYTDVYKEGFRLSSGVTGKLYQDRINTEVATSIAPSVDGEYTVMTMTGAEAKALAAAGFDAAGDGDPCPYALAVRDGTGLEDDTVYRVAFPAQGYTEETAEAYDAQVLEGSLQGFLRDWLEEQKTVSPGENFW